MNTPEPYIFRANLEEDSCPAPTKPKVETEVNGRYDKLSKERPDTRYNDIKHLYEFSDISTAAPTRFPDMGYLLFGYDLYKGNILTFGFDPGFRHQLFDYGKIEDYGKTLDQRHQIPIGTTALPSQACNADFKKTTIRTVEDLQERQGSAYSTSSSSG